MKKKLVVFSAIASVAVVGTIAAICGTIPKTEANVPYVKGVEPDKTEKRLYVVLNDDSWEHTTDGNLWIFGQTGSGNSWTTTVGENFNNALKMTLIGGGGETRDDGYAYGLYYADIPAETNKVIFKNYDGAWADGYDSRQTNDIMLSEGSENFALWIENPGEGKETAKRNVNLGYVPALTSEQLAEVLAHEHIDSCSPSSASGYFAWKQLENIFLTQNLGEIDLNTIVDEGLVAGDINYETTLGELINALATRAGYLAPEWKFIYFEDASWWNGYNVVTSVYAYGDEGATFNAAWPGTPMAHLKWEANEGSTDKGHSWHGVRLNVAGMTNIQFVRSGFNGTSLEDWNARTVNISLSDIPEGMNMYSIINSVETWYNNVPENAIIGTWETYIA